MKILVVHNSYQESGGEDRVVAIEARLLAAKGHQIVWYRRDNHEIPAKLMFRGASIGLSTVWAFESSHSLSKILRTEKPDVAHFHNTFPLISPSAYYACAKLGVPVIQTLHNYRLLCPEATFFRDGHGCEQCLGRAIPWPAVSHRCYRNSRAATVAVSAMLAAHRALGTWQNKVDMFIAVSEFARRKFVQGGLPHERIRLKPNFVHPDPGPKTQPGEYALYIGRLTEAKGVRVMLDAWRSLSSPIPLWIAGDGPLKEEILASVGEGRSGAKFLGSLGHENIFSVMHGARCLVFPSLFYESFPLSVIEAMACGLPVIASRLGSMADTIADGSTGLHFSPGDSRDLAAKCEWVWNHPEEMQQMGRNARAEYLANYTAARNYEMLMNIYQSAIERRRSKSCSAAAIDGPRKLPHCEADIR